MSVVIFILGASWALAGKPADTTSKAAVPIRSASRLFMADSPLRWELDSKRAPLLFRQEYTGAFNLVIVVRT